MWMGIQYFNLPRQAPSIIQFEIQGKQKIIYN